MAPVKGDVVKPAWGHQSELDILYCKHREGLLHRFCKTPEYMHYAGNVVLGKLLSVGSFHFINEMYDNTFWIFITELNDKDRHISG